MINLDFTGRHVVVFGGTMGINLGVARAFLLNGAAVTVVSRNQANVDAACADLSAAGPRVHGACADVRDYEAVGAVLRQAVDRFGLVDVLLSGAAGNFLCKAKDMSSNGFRAVVDIDLVGTFHVVRQTHAFLRKPGGVVINITAPQAVIPMRYQLHACAAKAGVDQLTRVLALEWAEQGIRVNAISPGPIAGTEGVKRLMTDGGKQDASAARLVPLGRLGTLDDIANLALFLASPHAGFISGAVIPCDGGGALESVKPALESAGRAAAA